MNRSRFNRLVRRVLGPLAGGGGVTASVNASGTTLTLVFTQVINSQSGGLTLHTSAGTPTLTYSAGTGTATLTYAIGTQVLVTDTPTLDYSGTGFSPSVGAFTGRPVTNGSVIGQSVGLPSLTARYPAATWTSGTWYDASGNGSNATQATGGSQFQASGHTAPSGVSVPTSPDANRVMTISGSPVPTTGSFAKWALVKRSATTGLDNLLSSSDTAHGHVMWGDGANSLSSWTNGANRATSTNAFGAGAWHLATCVCVYSTFTSTTASLQHHVAVDGQFGGSTKYVTNFNAAITTGGMEIGNAGTTFGFVGDLADLGLCSAVPSAANWNTLFSQLNTTYGTTIPAYTATLLLIGDSITCGYQADSSGASWGSQLLAAAAAANPTLYPLNLGRPSWGAKDILAAASDNLYPVVTSSPPTTCVVWCGTNDIALESQTAAQTWASVQGIVAGLVAAGAAGVWLVTMLPRNSVEATRQQFNNLIRANWQSTPGVVGILDVETLAMGVAGANTSLTNYNADQIHPNDTGHNALYAFFGPLFLGTATGPAFPSVLPAISGSTVNGNLLTVSTGNWAGSPTFAYQWKSGGANVGTNSNTYTTAAGDVGNLVTCQVTATTGGGSTAVISLAVGPVT